MKKCFHFLNYFFFFALSMLPKSVLAFSPSITNPSKFNYYFLLVQKCSTNYVWESILKKDGTFKRGREAK